VGLVTHKAFRIGATLTTNPAIVYDEIPRFSPEAFATIRNIGTAKQKQFREGMDQLLDEGVIQAFRTPETGMTSALLGAVGQLQFDVVLYRLQNEYGADPRIEPSPYALVRWFDAGVRRAQYEDAYLGIGVKLAEDLQGNLVILFPTQWALDYFLEKNPGASLHTVSPHAKALPVVK
jgi:peptide chain release factor 3